MRKTWLVLLTVLAATLLGGCPVFSRGDAPDPAASIAVPSIAVPSAAAPSAAAPSAGAGAHDGHGHD